jgi:hypothetical protein
MLEVHTSRPTTTPTHSQKTSYFGKIQESLASAGASSPSIGAGANAGTQRGRESEEREGGGRRVIETHSSQPRKLVYI